MTDKQHPADEIFNQAGAAMQGGQVLSFDAMRQTLFLNFSITYSVEYTVKLEGFSQILEMEYLRNTFVFHPFRRPIYHRAESWLDEEVFRHLLLRQLTRLEELEMDQGTKGTNNNMFKTIKHQSA
jgi:hypothetical protein